MTGFKREGDAIVWEKFREIVRVEPWGPDSLRVRATRGNQILDQAWALLEQAPARPEIVIEERQASIRNGMIEARLDHEGHLRFFKMPAGEEILTETWECPPRWAGRAYKSISGDLYRIEVRFNAAEGERFYGLGQHTHGRLDQKGCVIDLEQRNTEVSIPFALSSKGYGFLWHNPAVGRVEFGHNATRWIAEASRQMDYWITAGETPNAILDHYTKATGRAPLLPSWASGFWQCKLRYRTQEELLAVAREYKRRGLPLSIIVSDFFHWTKQGDWKFDPACWPDPAAMIGELDELGVRLMVSIWPTVNPKSENFQAMEENGYLIGTERGVGATMSFIDTHDDKADVYYYDSTHPEARKFVWSKVRDNYYHHGIKVWWLDACEPEIQPPHQENIRYHLGDGLEVACIYPQLHQKGFYEGMRSEGEQEIITLCRSAWAGSQKYAAAVWSGDIASTFEVLQAQVRAGLNIGLSGIPWWTTDIGGFHGGDPESPYFRELIIRWFQYGVFCPLFRLHGVRKSPNEESGITGGPNEIWSFGDEAYGIIRGLLFLRERLRPYIMAQMRIASEHGTPPMRPLFFDFPQDRSSWDIDDAFLFGPDILAAPVMCEGARSRKVYLPAGADWTDVWTGERTPGGTTLMAPTPLEHIPVYLKNGAQLPIRG